MRFRIVVDGDAREVEIERTGAGCVLRVDGVTYRARVRRVDDSFEARMGRARHRVRLGPGVAVVDGVSHRVRLEDTAGAGAPYAAPSRRAARERVAVRPPMPGRVVRLAVSPGAAVRRGQTIAVLEAMKMQNEIPAPSDGVVREVLVAEGESIAGDRVIAVLEAS